MRASAWLLIGAVASFFYATIVDPFAINPWPGVAAGFLVTAVGIILLGRSGRSERE